MPDMISPAGMPSIDDAYINRLFQIESGGNPNATTGSYRGLGQFGPDLEAKYGINDSNRNDPTVQANAVRQLATENAGALSKALGRPPTPGELYLAHQQGGAGAPALINAPAGTPAWQAIRPYYKSDAVAQKAITGNIPRDHALYGKNPNDITADDFTRMWVGKFEGSRAAPAASAPAVAPPVQAGGMPAAPSDAPIDLAPAAAGAPAQQPGLGMLDPNGFAKMAGKFGAGGMGMLNGSDQMPQMRPMQFRGGTPTAQMMRAQLLSNILRR